MGLRGQLPFNDGWVKNGEVFVSVKLVDGAGVVVAPEFALLSGVKL